MDWGSAFVLVALSAVFVVLARTIRRLVWVEGRIDVERRCRYELDNEIKAMLARQGDAMRDMGWRIEKLELEKSDDHA